MKIISVDYGDVRTGIAVCDKNEILASPLTVIKEDYQPKLIKRIGEIIEKEQARLVIVGMPRNMDGSYGFRAEKCRMLGENIKETLGINVQYEDERLTTVIAHGMLSDNNIRTEKHGKNVDAVSAAIILQDYIDKNKSRKSE